MPIVDDNSCHIGSVQTCQIGLSQSRSEKKTGTRNIGWKSLDDVSSIGRCCSSSAVQIRGRSCHHLVCLALVDASLSDNPSHLLPSGGARGFLSVEGLNVDAFCRTSNVDQGEQEGNDTMSRHPPSTLDTVLENLPLVYNSATKRLERRRPMLTDRPDVRLAAPDISDTGAGLPKEQDSAAPVAFDSPPLKPAFKKGHVRHGSYESAQIQLYPRGSVVVPLPQCSPTPRKTAACPTSMATRVLPSCLPPVDRTNSLHRPTDSVSSTVSFGSYYSTGGCSAGSAMSVDTSTTTRGSAPGDDSGCGSSKASSLDRKSQCSHASSGIVADVNNIGLDDGDESARRRPHTLLPAISLPKSLFSRKGASTPTGSGASWKLFSLKPTLATTATPPPSVIAPPHHSVGVVSTTALIINDRPAYLPAKSDVEAQRHRQQYESILEAAKKKQQREEKLRKKTQEQQRKLEEHVAAASKQWNEEILPKWEEMRHSRKCRDLWWQGLPPNVRGRVWSLVIGNDLNITPELYEICLLRAKQKLANVGGEEDRSSTASTSAPVTVVYTDAPVINREGTVELIHLDVSRTFPSLGIFQHGGPYYDLLLQLLSTYVCYRPDVGYVQSMSFVAAVLLLNADSSTAFAAFANLLNRPLQLAFYRLRQPDMTNYFLAYHRYFRRELPRLHAHFELHDVPPDLYLIEWLYTLYAKSLPYDITCRVWDVYLRDGEEFLFKTALGILRTFESELLTMDFDQCVQFLSHLPQERLTARLLFKNIEPFVRTPAGGDRRRRRFAHILADVAADRRRPPGAVSCDGCSVACDHNHAHEPRLSRDRTASCVCPVGCVGGWVER